MNISVLNPHVRYAMVHRHYERTGNRNKVCYDCRIFFAENAEGYIIADDTKYNISSGTAIFLPPKTKYRFSFTNNENFKITVLDFDLISDFSHIKNSLGTSTEEKFDKTKVPEYPLPELLNAPIVKSIPQIKSLLVQCAENFLNKKDFYRETTSALVKLCLLEFIKENKNNSYSQLCEQVLEYIHKNYANPEMNNIKIAEIFNYHPYHLSRIILEETGKTLHTHITDYRLRMAKNLLITTDYTIEQISWKCGFSSTAYFIKLFKMHTSTTPKKYRNAKIHTEL